MEQDPRQALFRALDSEVHVWLVRIDAPDAPEFDRCLELVSPEERERAAGFKFDRDRSIFVVAHALARTTLSRYAEIAPRDWAFRANGYGRPEIATPSAALGLRFNLSHTRGLAACAVGRDLDLGVDVEQMRDTDQLGIAKRAFSADEISFLNRLPAPEQKHAFYRHWTLKEAYIKARGMGLSIPTSSFSLVFGPADAVSIRFEPALADAADDWQLFSTRPTPEHTLGLALCRGRSRDRRVVVKWSQF